MGIHTFFCWEMVHFWLDILMIVDILLLLHHGGAWYVTCWISGLTVAYLG
jgi:hypothetical protein